MKRDIVHVLSGLGRGGTETWLVNVLRTSPALRARSVLCLTGRTPFPQGGYQKDIESLGVPTYTLPLRKSGAPFVARLAALLRRERARVVHSHINFLGGMATFAGRIAGVPIRIAHYHALYSPEHRTLPRLAYARAVQHLEAISCTQRLSCSELVLDSYRAEPGSLSTPSEVLYCGIDLGPFHALIDPRTIRRSLGIPDDVLVLGHVGSFSAPKNHEFLIAVAAQLPKNSFHLLLVGDGTGRRSILEHLERTGLRNRATLAGIRQDVAQLLGGAMDVFVFPSLREGLGLALVEAQAAGLPCVVSTRVPEEATVIPELVTRLPIESPATWATACMNAQAHRMPANSAVSRIAGGRFDLERAIRRLEEIYELAPPALKTDPLQRQPQVSLPDQLRG